MQVKRILASAVIAASMGIGFVQAQDMADVQVPAEFPPASYEGRQYVDSRGCVYVRTGIAGNVTWVPRVSRSRKPICGFKSSSAGHSAKPTQTAAPPKPQPKRMAKTVIARAGEPACQGASAISRQYYRTAPGVSVRCGPQGTPHVSVVQSRTARADAMRAPRAPKAATYSTGPQPAIRQPAPRTYRTTTNRQVRVAPKHVFENQKNSTVGISVPEGYKPVWDDDRLNTKRAHQTFAGMAQMEVAWSNTVPRYLIDRNTGRDISFMYPDLQYPYTSFEAQRAAGVTVATQGRVVLPPQPVAKTSRRATVSTRQATKRTTTVSTRSVAPETTPQKKSVRKASHSYVQVGAFRDATEAQRAAQRLANSGLPTRMGRVTRGAEAFSMVKVGPFRTQPQLDRALRKVRGKGYGQARPGN